VIFDSIEIRFWLGPFPDPTQGAHDVHPKPRLVGRGNPLPFLTALMSLASRLSTKGVSNLDTFGVLASVP